MVIKPRLILEKLRSSMWVVPLSVVVLMVGAAQGLLELDRHMELNLRDMAGASIEGARGMLQAVATSMVTVAGIVFSLTLLVLAQTSMQYSPRVLRNFLRDRLMQSVLGVFLGVYAYCLVVMRGMGDNAAEMPGLAIFGGLVAALVSIVYLIYFFHHIAESLQLENILGGIEDETLSAIKRLYPEGLDARDDNDVEHNPKPPSPAHEVTASRAGYLQDIELTTLLRIAERLDGVVYVLPCVGDFVVQRKPLAVVVAESVPDTKSMNEIATAFSLGLTRSIQQDPAFGIRQMVDVAMKGLSTGINQTTNAIMVLDRISVLMLELTVRGFPHQHCLQGNLRLVMARPGYESLLGLSFDQIRQWGSKNTAVLARLLEILGDLLAVCPTSRRRAVVLAYGRRVLATVEESITEPGDLAWIRERYKQSIGN